MKGHTTANSFLIIFISLLFTALSGCSNEESSEYSASVENGSGSTFLDSILATPAHTLKVGDHVTLARNSYICVNRSKAIESIKDSPTIKEYCYNKNDEDLEVEVIEIDETNEKSVSKVFFPQTQWSAWVTTAELILK